MPTKGSFTLHLPKENEKMENGRHKIYILLIVNYSVIVMTIPFSPCSSKKKKTYNFESKFSFLQDLLHSFTKETELNKI